MKKLWNVQSVMCKVYLCLAICFSLHITHFTLHSSFAQQEKPSSGELIVKSWQAHGKKDVEETFKYTQQLIDLYKDEADKQQASLRWLPKNRPDIEAVSALNDVATAHFIQGESYRDQEKKDESKQT